MHKSHRRTNSFLQEKDGKPPLPQYKSVSFHKQKQHQYPNKYSANRPYENFLTELEMPNKTKILQRSKQMIKKPYTRYERPNLVNQYKKSKSKSSSKQKQRHSQKSKQVHQKCKQFGVKKQTSVNKKNKKSEGKSCSSKSKSIKYKKQPSTNQVSNQNFTKTYQVTYQKSKSSPKKKHKAKGIRWQQILQCYGQYLSASQISEIRGVGVIYFLGKIKERKNRQLFKMQKGNIGSARRHHNCSQIYDVDRPYYNQLLSERKHEYQITDQDNIISQDEFYHFQIGDHIAYRYEIISSINKGAFGEVVKVFDHKNRQYVALKIIKRHPELVQQTLVQISILTHISQKDKDGLSGIIKIKDFTIFRKHICIIFELLDGNLYDLMVANNYNGFPEDLIRVFAIQLLNSLEFLRKEGIIHCDLKPQNIVLNKWGKSGIKIIDFGTSCYEGKQIYKYLQSRYYRAPQIIIQMPYSFPIDVWSLGCILAEFKIGEPIFAGSSDIQQLMYITNSIGFPQQSDSPFSNSLLMNQEMKEIRQKNYISQYHQLNSKDQICKHQIFSKFKYVKSSMQSFQEKIRSQTSYVNDNFIKFIEKMLVWDPDKRITPKEALQDPWIVQGLSRQMKQMFTCICTAQSKEKKSKSKSLTRRQNKSIKERQMQRASGQKLKQKQKRRSRQKLQKKPSEKNWRNKSYKKNLQLRKNSLLQAKLGGLIN